MDNYICLTGEKIIINPIEDTQLYKINKVSHILTYPISLTWFNEPVVFRNNIYEKKLIVEWLQNNDKDPLTGEIVNGFYKICPINIIKYLIMCFEQIDDKHVLFHITPNTLEFVNTFNINNFGKSYMSCVKSIGPTMTSSYSCDYKTYENKYIRLSLEQYFEPFDNQKDVYINQQFILKDFSNCIDITFNECEFRYCNLKNLNKNNIVLNDCIFINNIYKYSFEDYIMLCPFNYNVKLPDNIYLDGYSVLTREKKIILM